jgi:hypothetical protein
MTLVFTESFDAQPTTAGTTLKTFLDTKWGRWPLGSGSMRGGVTLGAGQTTLNVAGRHGTGIELRGGPTNVSGKIEGLIDDALYNDTIIVGYACKITTWVSGGTQDLTLLQVGEKIAAGDVAHVYITIAAAPNASNTFTASVFRSPATLLGTFTAVPFNQWFYFETKIKISDSFGLVEIRVDGVPVFYQANIDTRNAGTGIVNCFEMHTIIANAPADYRFSIDDVYVLSAGGSAPFNDFLGDVTIDYVQPTANDTVAWTPSAGANWDAVADAIATGVPVITDYVSSNVDDQSDLYVLADTAYPAPSVIIGAATYAYADKTDSGGRSLGITNELSGTTVQSSDLVLRYSGNGGPQYCRFPRELAPDGGAWTTTKANTMKVGVKSRP